MIKLTNISKYYDYSSGRTYALRNLSLTIEQGESVAIVTRFRKEVFFGKAKISPN